ncbi:MAG: hypothetical protein R2778_07460 [Saprospiraceae bacterium]
MLRLCFGSTIALISGISSVQFKHIKVSVEVEMAMGTSSVPLLSMQRYQVIRLWSSNQ